MTEKWEVIPVDGGVVYQKLDEPTVTVIYKTDAEAKALIIEQATRIKELEAAIAQHYEQYLSGTLDDSNKADEKLYRVLEVKE